jgi:hypothetical protein
MIKRLPEGTENKASKGFLYLIGGFVFLDISSIRDLAPGVGIYWKLEILFHLM